MKTENTQKKQQADEIFNALVDLFEFRMFPQGRFDGILLPHIEQHIFFFLYLSYGFSSIWHQIQGTGDTFTNGPTWMDFAQHSPEISHVTRIEICF